MADWDRDESHLSGPAATSLPTPQGTPYRTPSGASKMSRRSVTPPPKGPSPPPMHSERKERQSKRLSRDIATDDTVSPLDPRRFTPTLHANLVSEILALRRDQEEKGKIIESLEQTLHSSKEKETDYQAKSTTVAKENRSLKRQLQLLEGGTSSALGELARERDEAVESTGDLKKRLETAQRKLRSLETDAERTDDLWTQDKDAWEEEKRKFERKVHVAESRLKTVLDEVAAFQAAQANGDHAGPSHGHDSEAEDSGRENDAASVRSMSMTNSIRFSVTNPGGGSGKIGNTLADELDFDDTDDQTDHDGRESVTSIPTSHRHTRNFSRDSVRNRAHQRNQSLDSLRRPGSVRGKLFMNQSVLEALEGEDEETPPKVTYVDTGFQPSPPPSPKIEPVQPSTPEPVVPEVKIAEVETPSPSRDNEIEANQRRKRVQISPPREAEIPKPEKMVSAASQTVEEPLSPPKTPERPETPPAPPAPAMVTTWTQTDDLLSPDPRTRLAASPSPPPIPSISIQPPTSRPTTPREPRLPPHFKHFGCQVNILSSPASVADAGIQTEGIKIDKRLAQLPAHLQPSAISSRPSSPNPTSAADPDKNFTPVPGNQPPPRNPRRLQDAPGMRIPSSPISAVYEDGDEDLHDAYPGNNDDGPLSNDKNAPIKRPHRFSSLFAGFDTASSDEGEFGDDDVSDTEYRTALSAPRPQSISSRPGARSPTETVTTSPSSKRQSGRSTVSTMKPIGTQVYSSFSLTDQQNHPGKVGAGAAREYDRNGPSTAGLGNRASVMRKAAMIQSGIATHGGRSRTPSLPDTRNPPFPIPQRTTSRKVSASAPTSEGQRSPTRADAWSRRGGRSNPYRSNSIRKVRSAAALPRHQRYRTGRQGSRSPPPLSPSTEAPESPGLPPLPRNDITTPRHRPRGSSAYKRHRHQPSTNTENTNITNNTRETNNTDQASAVSGGQTIGVVDAIAQAMVGEWMFKYVRRRKSFSVAESNGKDDVGNDRHKRWVWLAPYERAILWSSKQPSSGSALMGKTGRKLVIQSVLDVKDDNPAPKNETGPIFNRSILILTPQRALKFTAPTPERHYIWLTALSFLAHSSQALPDIMNAPQSQPKPVPAPEYEPPPPPQPKTKRAGIRDSIRLAKGKTGPNKPATPSVPSIPSVPSSRMGDAASFKYPDNSIGNITSSHMREQSDDIAEPPFIPRFHDRASQAMPAVHGRKRSNTGGHTGPPLSFRGFSGPTSTTSGHNPTNSTAGNSVGTAGSSDYYNQSQSQSQGSGNTWGMSQTASQRTSEASSRPGNFFDAIGTVRMEAFISPLGGLQGFSENPDEHDEIRQVVRRRSKELRRRQSRRNSSRTRDSHSYASRSRRGSDDRYMNGSKTAGEEDYFRDDPFRGF